MPASVPASGDLSHAWGLISTNPAAAAGLADRGAISEGLRADLVLVDPEALRVVATIAGGHVAYLSPAGAARFSASVHTGQSD